MDSDPRLLEPKLIEIERSDIQGDVAENTISAPQEDISLKELHTWLDVVADPNRDWLSKSSQPLPSQIRLAVSSLQELDKLRQLEVVLLVSCYLNPHVPWSNAELAREASAIQELTSIVESITESFAADFRQRIFKASEPKLSLTGRRTQAVRLALNISKVSYLEDDPRTVWKRSSNVSTLSSVCFFILDSDFQAYWPMVASFILNIMDDPEPSYRAQGCFLLLYLFDHKGGEMLEKSGLVPVFKESLQTCLSYLPALTPASTSLFLLQAAYPALLQLTSKDYTPNVEIIGTVLSSIAHIKGHDRDLNAVVAFLLEQLRLLVERVGLAVLVCIQRINFVVNQIIANPYIVDTDDGSLVVNAALLVHQTILKVFTELNDEEAASLILQYKYDYLGAWTVLGKRIAKFGVGTETTPKILEENLQLLMHLASMCGSAELLEEDIKVVQAGNPELL